MEEPPNNTIIILQAKTLEDFLPTIISRCKVYEIKVDQTSDQSFTSEVTKILESSDGEKLEIASKYGKDKETAMEFVQQIVMTASEMAKKENSKNYLSLLKNMNEAYSTLKYANVNPRFVLENFLLEI